MDLLNIETQSEVQMPVLLQKRHIAPVHLTYVSYGENTDKPKN